MPKPAEPVYLDYFATTPCLPEVVAAMLPYFIERFHNPQSSHPLGEEALEAVETARRQIAALIGAAPGEITFTSGATESVNWVIKSLAKPGRHLVTSQVEHFSTLTPCQTLERQGVAVTYLPVDPHGLIDPAEVKKALRPETTLVTLIHASNELGTLEPIREIAQICRAAGVPLHVDASNTAGTIPVNLRELGADLLTLSPHMFYGPKGVGALYCDRRIRLTPLLEGGTQEDGRRAGTENVPGIVGAGVAAELARRDMSERVRRWTPLRDYLLEHLPKIEGVRVTGHPSRRLPNHASCVVEHVEGESVLLSLGMNSNIYAASGTACGGKAEEHSHVLKAIGIGEATRSGSLVFGLGLETTMAEIEYVLQELPLTVRRLRALSPLL